MQLMTQTQFKEWRLSQKGKPKRGKNHTGWSQQEAANYFKRSLRTVQSWESGRPIPKQIQQKIEEKRK